MSRKPQPRVVFYQISAGNEPVREWLTMLLPEDRKIIGDDLKTVQIGWSVRMPLVRRLEPGLWRVRSRLQHGTARVFFTLSGETLVLLHGSIKKPENTLMQELQLVRQRLTSLFEE
jgi:phage-related protein